MRCYYCMEQGRDTQAVALCRWCGAAACCEHVLEVHSAPELVVRMAKPAATRREFVCFLCWEDHRRSATPVTSPQRRKADRHEDALPEATDAVQVAEAFLRRKYRHRLGNLHFRLQALGSLLASKFHRAWLIPSAGVKSRRERT